MNVIRTKYSEDFISRFWGNICIKTINECWNWQRCTQSSGYGSVGVGNKKTALAHRIAYELTNGEIPVNKVIRHKCDNKICCNPRHLLKGTILDNNRDAKERGRLAVGERNGRSKFSNLIIIEFREKFNTGCFTISELARMYSMSQGYASGIASGKYRELPLAA